MKISEVCDKTGLTKRTIRFYEEKGLIAPESEDKNGKSFREYSDDDVRTLNAVSTLRRLDFSIDEISQMINAPDSINAIVTAKLSTLISAHNELGEIINTLEGLAQSDIPDIYCVADVISGIYGLDSFKIGDKVIYHKQINDDCIDLRSQPTPLKAHKRLKLLALGALVCFALIYAFSWLPETVCIEHSGTLTVYHDGKVESISQDTFTFKGKIYRPLFPSLSGRYATGSFYMKNTPEVCGECTFKNTSFSTRLDPDNGKRSYDSFSFDYNNDGIYLMFNSEADGYHFLIDGSLKNEGKEFEFK